MKDYEKLQRVLDEIGVDYHVNLKDYEHIHVTVRNDYIEDVESQAFSFMFDKVTGEYKEQ
jgi:hypothetical protein